MHLFSADYISPETIGIQHNGRVDFLPLKNGRFDELYLAPEIIRDNSGSTEKACLFSISATLFYAADYNQPRNSEPDLSNDLDNMMVLMTETITSERPTAAMVLQVKWFNILVFRKIPNH